MQDSPFTPQLVFDVGEEPQMPVAKKQQEPPQGAEVEQDPGGVLSQAPLVVSQISLPPQEPGGILGETGSQPQAPAGVQTSSGAQMLQASPIASGLQTLLAAGMQPVPDM
jgi:hypothetical protein